MNRLVLQRKTKEVMTIIKVRMIAALTIKVVKTVNMILMNCIFKDYLHIAEISYIMMRMIKLLTKQQELSKKWMHCSV